MAEKEHLGFDGTTVLKQQTYKRTQVGYICNLIERFNNRELTNAEMELIVLVLQHDSPMMAGHWNGDNRAKDALNELLKINSSPELKQRKKDINAIIDEYNKKYGRD